MPVRLARIDSGIAFDERPVGKAGRAGRIGELGGHLLVALADVVHQQDRAVRLIGKPTRTDGVLYPKLFADHRWM